MTVRQHGNQPPVAPPIVRAGVAVPDRLYVLAPGLKRSQTRVLSLQAVAQARLLSPKLSGRAAQGIAAYYGDGFFGVKWDRPYLWTQEAGSKPHTMRSLAGKTIPMWIDDPLGIEHRKNPRAETRITASGRRQVLIFRKAAKIGARKRVAVRDGQGRLVRWRDAPASYPGAPGRISHREFHDVRGATGKIARLTSRPHMGVRWRHPGLVPREFMQYSIQQVATLARIADIRVYATYRRR